MTDESTPRVPFIAAGFIILISLYIIWHRRADPFLDAIPTEGFSDPLLSYLSAFRFTFLDGPSMLKEGYAKTKLGLFKFAMFRRWVVVLSNVKLIEDVRKAPDDVLSNLVPLAEIIQTKYTLEYLNMQDTYHRAVLRSKLSRNTAVLFDQVHDELVCALRDFIPISEEWVKLSIIPIVQRLVCRISNRVFVGAPLCRNPDYQTLALTAAMNVAKMANLVQMIPHPLKPIVPRIISKLPSQIRQAKELIRPIVEERLAKMDELGDTWDDPPSDILMWLMNEAKGVERSADGLARRMVLVNFLSVHMISFTFTQVLYRLLAHPEHIEPLRQEVEAVVAEEGWTKAGMDKMTKVDSFIRETQRMDGLEILGVSRVALRPFTFSNGVTIPAGTFVSLPFRSVHTDEELYPNAEEFDGFRFSKLREKESAGTVSKHQIFTTSVELLAFGFGRHACPGRFLAAYEMKALLGHFLVTYDMKFEEGKGIPREHGTGLSRFPGDANVLFRRRQK
ncbi:cytochrome P450 [Russula earlei]|uniref:Cytochrome P450 n=1 Tax=Russula earlei TaxID=71964 RepID=A0ACC0UCU6_9AGAM|nr:cytochrome P450 [Russula earlei]